MQHRDLCCDILDLAHLNSLLISVVIEFSSVAIEFSSVATEFNQLAAFIVATKNFFVAIEILPSIFHYVVT